MPKDNIVIIYISIYKTIKAKRNEGERLRRLKHSQ